MVEEKASRVIEVLLATIRPSDLLAGKVIGLGVLGLGQLLIIAALGVAVAAATGALDVDGDVARRGRARRSCWFVLGYAFYAGAVRRRGRAGPAPGGAAELDHAARRW